MKRERLLDRIDTPHKLRRLNMEQLQQLADELRDRIVEVVSRNGGHLASNLGVAELTIALHYVFDFSKDRLVWDVGHQCYSHKMLTSRNDRFDTLRRRGGISGYPSPDESPYDLFVTGHAGTAISAAAGLSWADLLEQRDTRVVAVVGDASIVNGVSMEAINNTGLLKRQFLVVLNDNSMAIDTTRGALAKVLNRIRMTHSYSDIKQSAENLLQHLPMGDEIADALRHIRDGLKTTILGGQIFEALGFSYYGPVDGHDVQELIRILQRLSEIPRPVLLHVHTQKGRGCQYAVEDPTRFHSPSSYTVEQGNVVFARKMRPVWTEVFSETLVELGLADERIVAITAAMPDGTGLVKFREEFPTRCIDVGMNESHAVGMAAGLAKAGMKPIVAIYSTFMQRAFDQVFQEVSLQRLPVVLCMDRAGLVGSDGAAHQGVMDIAYLRPLPGMVLIAPADAVELRDAMRFALSLECPVGIRYPRDEIPEDLPAQNAAFELGKGRIIREGEDGTFLCYGVMVEPALRAGEILQKEQDLNVAVVNARFAKPLDVTLISRIIASGQPVVVCEDHVITGGFGSAVMELVASRGLLGANVRLLGIPDRIISHATRSEQLSEVGLTPTDLAASMKDMILHPISAEGAGTSDPYLARRVSVSPKPSGSK